MTDEPNGTGNPGGQAPPPPLAPDPAPPPLAAPPPPLAAVPPPLAAAPPPMAPPAPVPRSGGSGGLIAGIVIVLLLAIGATLYFTGVFDRRPAADPAQAQAPATAPAAGSDRPLPTDAYRDQFAECETVLSELQADDTPLSPGQNRNRVVVNAGGEILWNGAPGDLIRFRQYLDISYAMSPPPIISVRFDAGAPPAQVDAVREAIRRGMHCDYRPS